ncbi:hypothetical protein HWV62_8080 [Athelia sp. TMB]|nr:hypothetical protein HWV62_8080 [Athelia sp. TMB]
MVIVDEKAFMNPPPAYSASSGPSDYRRWTNPNTFAALPSHLLLKIVYYTFPQPTGVEERIERQRKTLYWMSVHLRLVNRGVYIACMHVLRSTYLPTYLSNVRPPYTSDPFPSSSTTSEAPAYTPSPARSPSSSSTSLGLAGTSSSAQRETQVLDNFIALKVREDVWADDSELHLERDESFADLFALMQPRARLEDLVHHYGARAGVVAPTAHAPRGVTPVPFSALSVNFAPRSVGLMLLRDGRKRTVCTVARSREERLEVAAKRLVRDLGVWLAGNGGRR